MIDFKTIKQGVKYLLENYPETRKSDATLYVYYIEKIENKEFNRENFKYGNLTNYETIRRVRQKLQEQNPELKDIQVAEKRAVIEDEYLKFALDL